MRRGLPKRRGRKSSGSPSGPLLKLGFESMTVHAGKGKVLEEFGFGEGSVENQDLQ